MSSKTKTTATNEDEKPALVPKLRFPEFRGAGRWRRNLVEDFFFVGSSKRVLQEDWTTHGVPFYRTRELVSLSKNESFGSEIFISEELFCEISEKYGLPTEGDFLVSGVGTLGISYQVKDQDRFYFKDGNVLWFRLKNGIVSTFFKYCFESDEIQNQISRQASISTVGTYTIQNAKATKFSCPTDEAEQQKIAECLSSLDEMIAAQARKVDALKTHKKGLMQQLFPREGETTPRLRFPEFRNAGEWDANILGELSEVVRGGSPRPIDDFMTTSKDGLNWLKIGDVDKEAKYVTNTAEKVRHEALSKTRVVNPGDLILSNSMSFGRPYILKITTCIHDGWIAITKISKKTDRDFLYYLISAPSSQSYFLDNAAGSGVLNLNADIIKALRVSFPKALEQQKIAECLSSLDELIAAQARKVDELKKHKRGLMQQLFPSSEEAQA
jgi:type I restriction enzyme, S subunit